MTPSRLASVAATIVLLTMAGACGSSGGHATAAPSTSTSTPSTIFSGVDSAEFCRLDSEFRADSRAAFASIATTPIATLDRAYARVVAQLRGMEKVASPEIRPAVTTVRILAEVGQPHLARAHYDLARLDPAGKALYSAKTAKDAADRLARYETEVCHA